MKWYTYVIDVFMNVYVILKVKKKINLKSIHLS